MQTLLILYNTRTGNTELMAKAIEDGAKTVQGIEVTLTYHARPEELQNADAVIIGTPTYNHHMTTDIQDLLEKTAQENIKLEGKIAGVFGSYGWSGEAPQQVLEVLQNKFQMRIIAQPILANYRPNEKILRTCKELGRKVAETLSKI